MKIAIIGAGWAGLAAALEATLAGHDAIVFEASHAVGGRARGLNARLPDGSPVTLDNGQHILIGAYTETLRLLRLVGIEPDIALLRIPMTLRFPDGLGLQFPAWPTPLDAFAGIVSARGWTLADKWSLLRLASGWQRRGFQCEASTSVAQLCRSLSPRVKAELIDPLCVSALNTPSEQASAQVFLRVLHDALFGVPGGSRLLLPRVNLSELFPDAAARWLLERGGQLRLGCRVASVLPRGAQWRVDAGPAPGGAAPGELFDAVIFAATASESARILDGTLQAAPESIASQIRQWTAVTRALRFQAITTVYAWGAGATLAHPMLCLRSDATNPAQFVFDRGQLGGPQGLLAFVVSASSGERALVQTQVLAQAQQQLGLTLQALQTIVEKRATFACTPGLQRPAQQIASGLVACGDYVAGPYPATLEGAMRSGVAAAATLTAPRDRQRA
jgi:squalene-associated FAD-dependent desaturase